MSHPFPDNTETAMLVRLPMQVIGLSIAYSVGLGWIERKFPNVKPDHVWAEVAGGVLLSLVPVALEARRQSRKEQEADSLHWQTYEGAVWRAFFASGTPIILWQIGEAIFRHMELMKYTAYGEGRSTSINAHSTPTLASGSGEREGTDTSGFHGGHPLSPGGPGED